MHAARRLVFFGGRHVKYTTQAGEFGMLYKLTVISGK